MDLGLAGKVAIVQFTGVAIDFDGGLAGVV